MGACPPAQATAFCFAIGPKKDKNFLTVLNVLQNVASNKRRCISIQHTDRSKINSLNNYIVEVIEILNIMMKRWTNGQILYFGQGNTIFIR
jgi:hypothetical protein